MNTRLGVGAAAPMSFLVPGASRGIVAVTSEFLHGMLIRSVTQGAGVLCIKSSQTVICEKHHE